MSFRKIVNAGIIMKRREGSAVDLGLKGKRVIIPASTKGILRRVVDQLVDEGCDVAICSRSEDTVARALRELSGGKGTAIGSALAVSVSRLRKSNAKSKVIILLTDGVNNSGFIDPKIASELAVEYQIKTYTIGLGSNGTARAPVGLLPNGKFQYGMTKVEIDEELLKTIAKKTGGLYFRATDNKKLEEIYAEINKLEKTEIEEFKYYNYDEKFRPLILLALALLFIEWLMRNTLFRSFI